jgi:CheY-like chemotaxis protein
MIDLVRPSRERRESPLKNIRIVVAYDSPVALASICSYLENTGAITVVGTARSGYELIEKAEFLRPDLVIADLRVPRMGGLECTMHLRENLPEIRIIIITEMQGPLARRACAEAGADDCVNLHEMPEELVRAIGRLFPRVLERP